MMHRTRGQAMTETELNSKLDEIDRLLNDPDTSLEPSRVWSLLDEVAQQKAPHP
jgi:hypothetical protein